MNLSYGLAKTGGAGASDWAFGTDLGIATNSQDRSWEIARNPAKGSISTFGTVVTGSGYSLGVNKVLVQSGTDGDGQGFSCIANIVEAEGILRVDSSVKNTAKFDDYQNSLRLAFDQQSPDPYTYVRLTATGQPVSGSTTAVLGTTTAGVAGTFIVNIIGGSVSSVTVAAGGSDYKVGEVVTITKANLESAFAGHIFMSDLSLILTEENVTGGIDVNSVRLLNGGVGHVVGNVITLTEENTTGGTGTLTVVTLDIANPLVTAPNNRYPRAVKTSTGDQGAPKTIEFVGMDDVNVIIGGFTAGTVFPFNFKQIIDAGTDAALGEITILY
tara:strand:+ start:546 stop:1529 length:984 start_codon:yes stop_codon:yes gene_type:complete